MKIEDVSRLLNEERAPSLQNLILAYLESHPDEVFRPKDKEELAAKVGWSKPGPVPGALIELLRKELISSMKVKRYIIYGKHETIDDLRKTLLEEVTLPKREQARRKLEKRGRIDARDI